VPAAVPSSPGRRRAIALRPFLLLIAVVAALAPVAADARPADLAGWRSARWGMREADLDRAFGEALARLPGRREHGDAYATRYLAAVTLGGTEFRAFFQMNAGDGRLQQVLLEPLRQPGQTTAFAATLDTLRADYGQPDGNCRIAGVGGAPRSVEYWWRFPTTTVRLAFFDFYTPDIIYEGELFELDPLADETLSGANQRLLPRRTLVRFHPTDRADFAAPGCPPTAR
jgi:hypothetical protein